MHDRRPTVLVVDDKKNMLRLMAKVLKQDVHVRTAESGAEAIAVLEKEAIDAVLCDLKMPDMDGLEVLRAAKHLRPGIEFVLMTAFASVGTAVEALRMGAVDYLTKPFEPEAARTVILRALRRQSPPESPEGFEVLPGVLARSPRMLDLAHLVRRVADSDVTALLLGETGTGKERIARALHQLGPRASQRFVAVNCSAIPPELLESELFGYARGSFTGATRDRPGLFEEANKGTLFLDEIGDMRLSLQSKLTRALEERSIRRIGESSERPVDVRVVAATHRDLGAMVRAGTFREDLWYRLNVAALHIPPLRDRPEDIELLAAHFLVECTSGPRTRTVRRLAPAALDAMGSYDWPGNVRQLRSAVERACVVAMRDEIEFEDLPPELVAWAREVKAERSISELTWAEALERGRHEAGRRYLEGVLRRYHGQVTEAAEHAGVERESFYRLMRRFGVDPDRYRDGKP